MTGGIEQCMKEKKSKKGVGEICGSERTQGRKKKMKLDLTITHLRMLCLFVYIRACKTYTNACKL